MNVQWFILIFTIWCMKGTTGDSCTPAPVISIDECSSGCNKTFVARGCTCSGNLSAIIVNADTMACSVKPLNFTYDQNSKTYDLVFFNNTIDLDQECMKTKSLTGKFFCGPWPILFAIEIESKNEFLPWFCDMNNTKISSPYSIKVNETLPKGGSIWDFNVCDDDKFDTSTRQVVIKSPNDGLFEINVHSNIFTLKFNSILDYDVINKYTLEMQIQDGDFDNVTLNLTINVTDVDNKPPAFDKQIYYMIVNEGEPKNTIIGKVHALDEDRGVNATIHFQLESVNGSDFFRIDKYSGNLYTNAIFDREKVDSYTLVVKAYQEDNPINRFTFAMVEVKISDVDDNPPVMSQKDYYAIKQENAPNDSFVIQIQATDADKDEINTKLFFQIVNPDPWHAFSLNSSTGIILVSDQSALDFETWTNTTMTVRAVSLHHENMFSGNSNIHISLIDMNDNSPQCGKDPDCTIHKDAHVTGSPICQVIATDPDSKGNGNLSYSVLRDDSELIPFSINNATGAIVLTKTISWSYVTKYRLDVVVEDHPQSLSEKRSTVCVVFIHVTDVNMFLPVIFSPLNGSELNIAEGASPPTILLQVNASAKDPSDNLEYKIDGGMGYFEIDHSSGVIHVNKTLDREQISSYIITVSVSDRVNHKSQSTFRVNVLGINENSPVFLNTLYAFQVVEETPDTMFYVKAHDRDLGQNGVVEYELQNNHWSSDIIINHTTGEIHVKSIDREILNGSNEIQLLVIAKDHGSPEQHGFALITITVKDINDHAPAFKEATRTFDLKEGYKGVFYHAQAIDPDEDVNAIVHYRMINGDESIFSISDTGDVSLWQPLVLDGRISDSITLEIEAYNTIPYTNQHIANGRQTLIIHIQDINDKYPVFSSSLYKVNIHETLQTGSIVASVHATDMDYSSEYNTVTYWIAGGDNDNTFYIDSRTGKIYLQKPVDFDPPSNQRSFSLTIQASDLHRNVNGSVINATTMLYITVLDENDNFPAFVTAHNATTAPLVLQRSDIECQTTSLKIFVPKDLVPGNGTVTWRDSACVVHSNGTHFVDSVGLRDCGTTLTLEADSVVFENDLILHKNGTQMQNGNNIVTYGNDYEFAIPVKCVYPRNSNISTSYIPIVQQVKILERRNGQLDLSMRQYEAEDYSHPVPFNAYPRQVPLNNDIFIRLAMENNVTGLGLSADNCFATSTPSPVDPNWYQLISSGCPVNNAKIHPSGINDVKFSFHAFNFRHNTSGIVYVHCQVSVCLDTDPACVVGCVTRKKRSASAREGAITSNLISTGPFILTTDEGGVAMSTVVASVSIAVAVIATVVAIIGWTRKSKKGADS